MEKINEITTKKDNGANAFDIIMECKNLASCIDLTNIINSYEIRIKTLIKSNLIKKVFEHEENPEIKTASYNKVEIYERMLPSVVLVGVQTQE